MRRPYPEGPVAPTAWIQREGNAMPKAMRCAQGHQWESGIGRAGQPPRRELQALDTNDVPLDRLAAILRAAGCAVLRFNYRGVNLSDGEYGHGIGETDDARAALAELRRRYPEKPLLVAGFSFGSRIALRLAIDEPGVERVIAAGFPTVYPDREYIFQVRIPKHFIQSTHDAFGPQVEMQAFFDSLSEPKQIEWIAAADHFFRDNLDGLEKAALEIGLSRNVAAQE